MNQYSEKENLSEEKCFPLKDIVYTQSTGEKII